MIFICCRIIIGFGLLNKEGIEFCYGVLLGDDEIVVMCEKLGWSYGIFEIFDDIYVGWDGKVKGVKVESVWNEVFVVYEVVYLEFVVEFKCRVNGELLVDFSEKVDVIIVEF